MKQVITISFAICNVAIFTFFACKRSAPKRGADKAKGVVTHVYEERVTRYGYKGPSYRVTFVPGEGKEPITVDGVLLARKYSKGDSVIIFFDSTRPNNAVTDK